MYMLWMSSKQLYVTLAKRIHAYTHIRAQKHTYVYIIDYLSTGEFECLLWWGVSDVEICCSSNNRLVCYSP
jgi:hypothetical protein